MRIGVDTTDMLVYGHEAWITTDKSVYSKGEEVHAKMRWGHNMRPDGFFRLDEFRAFVSDEMGNRIALSPVKGTDEQGDFYHLDFTPLTEGIQTIMAIYDNNYVRNEKDEYFEGDRRTYPDILDAKNYPQIYETCVTVGEKEGVIPFIHESRVSFVPQPWKPDTDVLHLQLIYDKFPVKGASCIVVHYDGENYFERFINTDENGMIFFKVEKPGTYMAVTRKGLAEGMEGIYDSKEIASTFTYMKR
ncbi:DUF4198 domain-containing protein [Butyrivibrio sp. AE2032]|uniref:DUF4198 domain-containing protein n=1 Tax=Butyrivibrio sp. AE2032 TaxID=1458463 RepID=UPI00054E284A|nr:DUF4198 domain-containing protein [Butyrivibrio sp. AE2032]